MAAMGVVEHFKQSYHEARQAFLDAAGEAGGRLEPHRHPQPGPDGARLFMDVAFFGDPDPESLLCISSGTHGVEGFGGSGIQVGMLRDGLAKRLPTGTGLLMVHAVNPHGFAWLRRVNEDNVDLNRNFLDHDLPYPSNDDYDALYDAINPIGYEDEDVAACVGKLAAFQKQRGSEAAYRALSGGQWAHPEGMQFGGTQASWSNLALRDLWRRHLLEPRRVVSIDLHSGLGPDGVGLLMQTAHEQSVGARLARDCWGTVIRSDPESDGRSALVPGLLGVGLDELRGDRETVAVVLEFGTDDTQTVLMAMHADNWLHHHGDASSSVGLAIKRRVRDAFYRDTDEWKTQIRERADEVVAQALRGMGGS